MDDPPVVVLDIESVPLLLLLLLLLSLLLLLLLLLLLFDFVDFDSTFSAEQQKRIRKSISISEIVEVLEELTDIDVTFWPCYLRSV